MEIANEPISGLIAEFENPDDVLHAAQSAASAGYTRLAAYSPFPIEGLAEAVGFHRTRLPLLVLMGGLFGGIGGFALQYWLSVEQYPLNIGGRPPNTWPMFIPVTFECTVLAAGLVCVLGMLALNRLPEPYHPLFDVSGFERASTDRFFLSIARADPLFDVQQTREFLRGLRPVKVSDIRGAEHG